MGATSSACWSVIGATHSASGTFETDRDFKSGLDRSARREAWRMTRRQERLDDF